MAPSSEKPSTSIQVVSASKPPASIRPHSPSCIRRYASPMACAAPAQAVLTLITGPRQSAARATAATPTFWLRSSTSPGACRYRSWNPLPLNWWNMSTSSCSSGRPTVPATAAPRS